MTMSHEKLYSDWKAGYKCIFHISEVCVSKNSSYSELLDGERNTQ